MLSTEKPALSNNLPALILHLQRLEIQASYKAEHYLLLLAHFPKKGWLSSGHQLRYVASYGFRPCPALALTALQPSGELGSPSASTLHQLRRQSC